MSNNCKEKIINCLQRLTETRENARKIVDLSMDGLINKKVDFIEIVEALESSLTHTNAAERSLGTQFLADILHGLPTNYANMSELGFLSSFFVNRMKDHHSVIPHVISGYMALVKQENLSDEDVSLLVHSIFNDIHCQSQVMADRRNIFYIFKHCLLYRKEVASKMNTEFLIGFVAAVDGEKDPRNLVLLFSIIPHIVVNLSLKDFAEDLFEVIAAYFPIDFIPPANDPFGIAPEDLILGLRSCLASTDAFAPYCLPLLLEKLDSDIVSAKLDSLLTLQLCLKNYSSISVSPHSIPLWNSFRREVVESLNEEVEKEALLSITALISNLEQGATSPELKDCINHLGSVSLMECLGHLSNPEQRLMFPSANILLAVIDTSPILAISIESKVLPLLESLVRTKREPSPLKAILTILAKFLKKATNHGLLNQEPLSNFQVPCFNVLYQELFSVDNGVQLASVCALREAATALTDSQKYLVTESMTKILMTTQNQKVRDTVIEGLKGFGQLDLSILSGYLNEIEQEFGEAERERLIFLLDTISTLTTTTTGFKTVWSVVWQQMGILLEKGSKNCIYYLQCMKKLVSSNFTSHQDIGFLLNEFQGTRRLVDLSIICISSFEDPVPILQEISHVCQELVRRESQEQIELLLSCLIGVEGAAVKELNMIMIKNIQLEQDKSSLLIFPMEGLMLSFKSFSTGNYFKEMILKIQHWSLHAKDSRIRETAAVLLSVLLNKLPTIEELCLYLEQLKPVILDNQATHSASTVRLLGWICKGLILRGYKDETVWVERLERLLLEDQFCIDASECYEFILKDVSAFSSSNGTKIRMLYKQRFFEGRIASLVQQFQSHEGKAKFSTLLSISYLLPHVPQVILKGHMKKLLPVLAQGLTCGDLTVTKGAVATLSTLLQHSSEDVKSYVSTLLPPLLKLTSSPLIVVRLKSLECLEALTTLPTPSIVPYKDEVTKGLQPALNDRKRIVRQAATSASCAWVMV